MTYLRACAQNLT